MGIFFPADAAPSDTDQQRTRQIFRKAFLKDSKSGKILARAADSASAPAFSTSAATLTDWVAVEDAAARWARLFREFLDENLQTDGLIRN